MSLCINPRCPEPDHYGNDSHRFCQSCGSSLILQNRYRVLRLLSDKSGFGKVYEAYDRTVPKILKVLKDLHNHNEKAVELFQQEAMVLSQLQHPGIPLIEPEGYFQFVPRDGLEAMHCIIMEKIDGPNLREWMKQQGNHHIGEKQALNWLQQISEVLHLVHGKNYFHRDIKPENLMLRSSGQLVLVDFGAAREMTYTYLAQLSGGSSGITRISSAGYTPPEQEYGQAVPQSDFYALGRTFIYLLTGKLPTDTTVYDPINNEFRWRDHAPEISPGLADFIDRLVATRVSDRPRNTQEMLDSVADLTRRSQVDRASSASRRSGAIAPGTQVNPITVAQPTGLTRLWQKPRNRWFVGSAAGLMVALTGYALWQLAFRGESPASVAIAEDVKPLAAFTGHQGNVNSFVISPGGQTLVSGSSDNTIKIWSLQTGELLRTLEGHTSFVNSVTVSPDGQTLISGGADRTVRLWQMQTGELLRTLEGHTSFVNVVVVSHNGQTLFSGSADGEVIVWDLQTGDRLQTLTTQGSSINALVLSHDSQKLISGSADGTIQIWDANTWNSLITLNGHTSPINALLVSPDGETLYSGGADGRVKVWNLDTGEEMTTLVGHSSAVNALQISSDGRTLFSSSADRTIKLWDLQENRSIATLTGFNAPVNDFVLSEDEQVVITNSQQGKIESWTLPDR